MSFFGNNKFKELSESFTIHEQNSKADFHQKHPHTVNIFDKHQVDLRNIRQKGVKATTAATILGAFLAFPHLLGHGSLPKETPQTLVQNSTIERQVEPGSGQSNTNNPNLNNLATNQQTSANQPIYENDKNHQSQGHIHGRSYLAPPKDHGLHDLGLHKGEEVGKGNAEAPGPHPEELEVQRGGNNL